MCIWWCGGSVIFNLCEDKDVRFFVLPSISCFWIRNRKGGGVTVEKCFRLSAKVIPTSPSPFYFLLYFHVKKIMTSTKNAWHNFLWNNEIRYSVSQPCFINIKSFLLVCCLNERHLLNFFCFGLDQRRRFLVEREREQEGKRVIHRILRL